MKRRIPSHLSHLYFAAVTVTDDGAKKLPVDIMAKLQKFKHDIVYPGQTYRTFRSVPIALANQVAALTR